MCNMDQQLTQLIQILSIALRCGNLTGDETQFTANIQQVLQIVLTNNLTAFTSGGGQEGLGQNQSQTVGQNFGFGNGSSDSAIRNNISGGNRGGNETGVLFSAFSPFAKSFLPPPTTGPGAGAQSFGFGFGNTTTSSSDIALIVPNMNGANVTPVNSSIFSGGYGGPGGPLGGPIFPGGPSHIDITKMQESSNSHRLHRLEIIKVIVLIVVISIILISTCRMVLQLFLRFRPEKNSDYI